MGKARRMKRATLALVMMTVASVLAAGTAMAVVDDAQRSTAGRDAALDRALEDLVSMRGGPPGAIAVVQRDEMRKVHTAGVADLSTGRPIGVNDRMRIASTSKAFSGAVALSLVSKGALSLNDTIGELLPKQPKSWREITLRQLLNHSSGLPDYSKIRPLPEWDQDKPQEGATARETPLVRKEQGPALRPRLQIPVLQHGQPSRGA